MIITKPVNTILYIYIYDFITLISIYIHNIGLWFSTLRVYI